MEVLGSCHCGRVKFYRVSIPAVDGSFRLADGKPAVYVEIGDSGSRRAQAFRSNCGSPLYTFDADNPKIHVLRVGCIA